MSVVDIIKCTEPAELYRRYDKQIYPQKVHVVLDLRNRIMYSEYDGSDTIPFDVSYGFVRCYEIPILTSVAANDLMERIRPMADRICFDWSEVASTYGKRIALLGEDALAAEDEILDVIGYPSDWVDHWTPEDYVTVWTVDDTVVGNEVEEFGITAETSDEELEKIEREMIDMVADCGPSEEWVSEGIFEYLKSLRDGLIAEKLRDAA